MAAASASSCATQSSGWTYPVAALTARGESGCDVGGVSRALLPQLLFDRVLGDTRRLHRLAEAAGGLDHALLRSLQSPLLENDAGRGELLRHLLHVLGRREEQGGDVYP